MHLVYGQDVAKHMIRVIEDRRDNELLVVCSAYISVWLRLEQALKTALSRAKPKGVIIAVRGGKDAKKHLPQVQPFADLGASILTVDRLHAKYVMGERLAVVGSMNLVESSASNSWEMACLVDLTQEERVKKQLLAATMDLGRVAKNEADVRSAAASRSGLDSSMLSKASSLNRQPEVSSRPRASLTEAKAARTTKLKKSRRKVVEVTGFCIRCETDIPHDVNEPLCSRCLKSWSRYGDVRYTENVCHSCGEPHDTCVAKPQCKPCWRDMA